MSTFMLKNSSMNYTPVSNVFIEKYMTNARGEFVKVYLLLLKYNSSNEPGVNSSILASSLNLLESDVMNALNYWNDLGVIKLIKLDKMNNFSVEFLPLEDSNNNGHKELNLLDALDNTETTDMLKEIGRILNRTLSPKEMEMYLNWQKDFNFSSELILLLVEYCASRNKRDCRYIERVAMSWNDKGINTMEKAQEYITKTEDKWVKIRKILSYLGIKNSEIMKPQEEMLEKWLLTYNFDLPMIEKACDKCFERLNRADFKYIDGILTKWHESNIKTLKDVEITDKEFKNKNNYNKNNYSNGYNRNKSDKVGFNNFKPRTYDYDSLEKKLLGWDNDD